MLAHLDAFRLVHNIVALESLQKALATAPGQPAGFGV
tara:strand:+ start:516 stop:626 length:111 start_codon:yes stop_codon:yes gene_type:complete